MRVIRLFTIEERMRMTAHDKKILEALRQRNSSLAQELEETHPEFVRTDEEGMKSVAYIDLLIAKIAELEARLDKAGI